MTRTKQLPLPWPYRGALNTLLTQRIERKKGETQRITTTIAAMALAIAALLPALTTVALAQTQVPGIQSEQGPAVAVFNYGLYIAFSGTVVRPNGKRISYVTPSGIQSLTTDLQTKVAPALAAGGANLYLAVAVSDSPVLTQWPIYYSALTSAGTFPEPDTLSITGALTTSSPALSSDGNYLYAAWTTSNGQIGYGYCLLAQCNSASPTTWTTEMTSFSTNPGIAPSLVVYDGSLFIAWVQQSSTPAKPSEIMYATAPVPVGKNGLTWSGALPVGAATSTVAPNLGVLSSLEIAYVSGGQIDYEVYESGLWTPPVLVPGPLMTTLTPALVAQSVDCAALGLVGGFVYYDVYYTQFDNDIYFERLGSSGNGCKAPKLPCKGPTCQ